MTQAKIGFAICVMLFIVFAGCRDDDESRSGQQVSPTLTSTESLVVTEPATEVPAVTATRPQVATGTQTEVKTTPTPAPTQVASAAPRVSCSVGGSGLVVAYSSFTPLVWVSHQIVEGTIVEQLPAVFGPPMFENGPRFIFTDFVFKVENRLRGVPHDVIHVRQEGGTIGDCTVVIDGAPQFSVGDQLLLFLYPDQFPGEGKQTAPTYGVHGRDQGAWVVEHDSDTSIPRAVPMSDNRNLLPVAESSEGGIPLDVFAEQVFGILSIDGGPPSGPGMSNAVPLEEAPLPPEIPDFGATDTPTAVP